MKDIGRVKLLLVSLAILPALFLFPHPAQAKDLILSGISLVDRDTKAKTIRVKFDITWENAWRNSINHDAAWVFIKYSTDAGATCTLGIRPGCPFEERAPSLKKCL